MTNINYNRVSDEDFITALKTSRSWLEVHTKLGYKSKPQNKKLKDRAQKLNLDITHIWGRTAIPLSFVLVVNSPFTHSAHLRERLIDEGLKKNQCAICGLTSWMENPISL